jgi:hypothetical protein
VESNVVIPIGIKKRKKGKTMKYIAILAGALFVGAVGAQATLIGYSRFFVANKTKIEPRF